MSMPTVPDINTNISRENAVSAIITSIAMEELALAHILNAEGEKLQYVLGTLEGSDPGEVTICDIMNVNDSIRKTLKEAMKTQMFLQFKLEDAIELDKGGEA